VGNCGNAVGTEFWDTIRKEHGLDASGKHVTTDKELSDEQLKKIGVYFNE
jgi:tubulin beta